MGFGSGRRNNKGSGGNGGHNNNHNNNNNDNNEGTYHGNNHNHGNRANNSSHHHNNNHNFNRLDGGDNNNDNNNGNHSNNNTKNNDNNSKNINNHNHNRTNNNGYEGDNYNNRNRGMGKGNRNGQPPTQDQHHRSDRNQDQRRYQHPRPFTTSQDFSPFMSYLIRTLPHLPDLHLVMAEFIDPTQPLQAVPCANMNCRCPWHSFNAGAAGWRDADDDVEMGGACGAHAGCNGVHPPCAARYISKLEAENATLRYQLLSFTIWTKYQEQKNAADMERMVDGLSKYVKQASRP